MKIAVVGSGISGLSAAHYLSDDHEVHVFEADDRLGGHTATKAVTVDGGQYQIDTGFIVFNDRTYPGFIELLTELGVDFQPTDMGFSVFEASGAYEYAGKNLNTLFSQRRRLFSLSHLKMLRDIVRFNKQVLADIKSDRLDPALTLGQYLKKGGYSSVFIDRYLVPMGAAIWSSSEQDMLDFPCYFFAHFFKNHGLLSLTNRPQWYVVKQGSNSYIEPLIQKYKNNIHLSEPVQSVCRINQGVEITTKLDRYSFDRVILACHSDQALKVLSDPSPEEKSVLGDMKYQGNEVILHTDETLLPRKSRTWSSWNYRSSPQRGTLPVLTYNMNILQGIRADITFCVTLNAKHLIHPDKILGVYHYAHPVFTQAAINAQKCWHEINGVKQTYFCGAYWANGFHEDGVQSALKVANHLKAAFSNVAS